MRMSVSLLIETFRENRRDFFKHYCIFIIIFVLALFCDAASTIHFMLRDGPDVEIHPLIRFVSRLLGPVAGPIIGALTKTVGGIAVCIILRRFAAHILVAASIISFWAAWYNLWGYKVYTPIILQWVSW